MVDPHLPSHAALAASPVATSEPAPDLAFSNPTLDAAGPSGPSGSAPPWPRTALLGFAAMLISLTTVATVSWLSPVRILTGLPDDPDVAAARAVVGDGVVVGSGNLHFASSLGVASSGAEPVTELAVADRAQRCARAEARLRIAEQRFPNDARIPAALGHLALATDRMEVAERRYRRAIDLAPSYGEARLGLGMALALRAGTTINVSLARALILRAIAQFAAVPDHDPSHGLALANRVVLLRRIGRGAEADRLVAATVR